MANINNKIIELTDVNFFYNKGAVSEAHTLTDITLDIKQGEYISFFGKSGCGKSTLLNVISGIDTPSSGKICAYNHDITKFSEKEMDRFRQIGIGFIYQNYNLIPSLRAIDNVTLPMSFIGISKSERIEKAEKIFKRLNIENLKTRYPHELSGGQQQRIGIARALANDPHIILADEPIGNLDSSNATNVLDMILDLNKKDGKTIVMVTHEKWSLRDVDRVFNIKDGIITSVEADPKVRMKGTGPALDKPEEDIFTPQTADEQVGMLASMVLNKYSAFEIKRFERILADRIAERIDEETFRSLIDKPFADGGVGLWKQSADRISEYVEDVITQQKKRKTIGEKIEINFDFPMYEEIVKIREWLLEDMGLQINPNQILRLDEIISDRIRDSITAENFKKILNLSEKKGGVGLKINTSLKVLEKMEIIMSEKEEDHAEHASTSKESGKTEYIDAGFKGGVQ